MKVRITNGMFMALIINMVYAKGIGLTQGAMAREVGSDMWIATLLSTLEGMALMFLTVLVIRRAPDKDLIGQSRDMLGKWASKFTALIFFVYFLAGYGGIMITFVYHLNDFFLPETPVIVFVAAGVLIAVFAVFHGLEVIGRMALIGVFAILSLNILIIFGSLSEFDIRELLPVFQSGVGRTLWASRHNNADWSLTTMMAAIVLPFVHNEKKWTKSGTIGILLGGLFIVLWPVLEAGVLSSEVTAQYFVSCMQLARSASLGYFLHRYEMIMIAFFALSSFTQLMMALLCASISFQKIFNMKNYKMAIIPAALALAGFSYWVAKDHHRAMSYLDTYWIAISMAISVTIPAVILVLGFFIKGKKGQPAVKEKG